MRAPLSTAVPVLLLNQPEMNASRNVFVSHRCTKSETTSTSRNYCGDKKLRDLFILEHVTVGNDSCNFCHNNARYGIIFDEPESLKINRLTSSSFFLLTF